MDNKNNINNKSTPNQMRILMKRMRDGKYEVAESKAEPKKNLSMRDMLKITRNPIKLNEDVEDERKNATNKKTVYDQGNEEEKFLNFFNNQKDLKINVKFIPLEVYDNLIFWGGTVDGIIQFVYKVTPDESTSGVEFNYLEDFTPDNPDNMMIVKMLKEYYDTFYDFWQKEILQPATPIAKPDEEKPIRTLQPQQQFKQAAE
jgi:hypothetical protein